MTATDGKNATLNCLDVGCGTTPTGDVNVDLRMGGDYRAYRTKANLYASVYNLPFRDGSFNIVKFTGLLHHLAHPKEGFREMLRVARSIVVGIEPSFNLFMPRDKTESHHLYRKKEILEITQGTRTVIHRTIQLCRLGKVTSISDRTWNFCPLVVNFLIIGWKQ